MIAPHDRRCCGVRLDLIMLRCQQSVVGTYSKHRLQPIWVRFVIRVAPVKCGAVVWCAALARRPRLNLAVGRLTTPLGAVGRRFQRFKNRITYLPTGSFWYGSTTITSIGAKWRSLRERIVK
jgi:hypothetical protein